MRTPAFSQTIHWDEYVNTSSWANEICWASLCSAQPTELGLGGAVHGRVQRQLRAGQVQRKQTLLGTGGSPGAVTAADGWHEHRGIGGDQAAPTPARHERGAGCSVDQLVIERLQRGHVQPCAGLGEGAIADDAPGHGIAMKHGKEAIERALLGTGALRQREGHERWQRHLAAAGEGVGGPGMARELRELRRGDGSSQIRQDGLDVYTVFRTACERSWSSEMFI